MLIHFPYQRYLQPIICIENRNNCFASCKPGIPAAKGYEKVASSLCDVVKPHGHTGMGVTHFVVFYKIIADWEC